MLRTALALALPLILALFSPLWAADPPKEPLLRIETGHHTAMINRIATDSNGRYLVTAADDKTLRVWETGSGRLLGTIRPPAGEGNEGKLFSVALSPDGSTIATGGWTGWDWERSTYIYLFNRASGSMTGRITGLPEVTFDLAFSPDGRYFAATLGGANGIRLYRTSDWSLIGEDKDYGDNSFSAHFSRDGRLVTTSYDGYLRLYEIDNGKLRRVEKEKAQGGSRPSSARFSPDGSRIAVGFDDTTTVAVFSGRDLDHLFFCDTNGTDTNLFRVAWSADGRFLFAGGRWTMIRRWEEAGKGRYKDTLAADNSISNLEPLPDGRLAFGAYDPAFGLLDQNGLRSQFTPPDIANLRENGDGFRASGDGSKIAFAYASGGQNPATFDVTTRSLSAGTVGPLQLPITVSASLDVTAWKHSYAPKLNGVPLKLRTNEISRSLAIAREGSSFILGTDWNLRRYDRHGNELWKIPAPGTVLGMNVPESGSVAIAAYGDGTIRWHRMSDGKELLAFFPHADRKRWVLWTPSGYYDASPGGEEFIGWQLNNGKDQAADFFPAAKFRATYYRPDVIAKVLDTLDEGEAVKLANAEGGRKTSSATVATMLPPVVNILSPGDATSVSSKTVVISYSARTPGDAPVTAIRVLVDGRPVEQQRGVKLIAKEGEQSIIVAIPERDCEVSIIAENRHATSVPATVRLTWAGKKPAQEEFTVQPKLYVLAVGVSAYKDKDLTLKYAAKDAQDFAAALARQKGGIYRDVQAKVLTDAEATKEDIMDGLDWLKKEVTSKDVGVIFIAGHGVNDQTGNYYFLPQNANPEKLMRTGVTFNDIKSTVASLAGKAIMFVDTCHSGNVMGTRRGATDINAVINELSSAENGVVVFASSTGRQYSLEDVKWGNGAFTKALVEGLDGRADLLGKGKITVNMLDAWLAERVKELTKGQQTPTTTKPATVPDFPLAVKR